MTETEPGEIVDLSLGVPGPDQDPPVNDAMGTEPIAVNNYDEFGEEEEDDPDGE